MNWIAQYGRWWITGVGWLAIAFALEGSGIDDSTRARQLMVDQIREDEGIEGENVLEAMREVPREWFVPKRLRSMAYYDLALPIGHGQTISPPSMVARMIDQLRPQPTDRVLEVGTGTGYQAAVLSRLVSEVCTVEIKPRLARQARANMDRLGRTNVWVKTGDGYLGWPERAPFDCIVVACSPEKVPLPLTEQLREGGRMVIPLGQGYDQMLYLLTKTGGVLSREAVIPTVFVPMTGRAELQRTEAIGAGMVNTSFEEVIPGTMRPRGWYHQRQLISVEGSAPHLRRYVRFDNVTPGRTAEASQAFSLDGRQVRSLVCSGWVKGYCIEPGSGARERASIVIAFYDAKRVQIGAAVVGEWLGTFEWEHSSAGVSVPSATREAIMRVGLCGATGSLSVDALEVREEREER